MRFANVGGRAVVVVEGRAVDVQRASNGRVGSDPAVYLDVANHSMLSELAGSVDPAEWPVLDAALVGPPVPRPTKSLAVGVNYRAHAVETGRELPTEPHFFAKTQNCITGPYSEIVLPRGLGGIDYEAELVVVIGRTCKGVADADAWIQVAGVMCGQDVSDRVEQRRPPLKQFTVAKSYDSFGPTGPVLVTPDELADPDALGIRCTVSGEVMQDSNTSDLIFGVGALIAWLTRHITFGPGDLIWTGTPGGVGEARHPQRFLRDGDVVETTIDGIGTMRNPVVER
jgi:2-keto-4-pentenoate hydratase/2-oxohepta-3-ene-1,7-dioic acid hydratase in catechol pathway